MIQVHYHCTEENCQFSNVWCSQPFSNGKMPVGNLLLSSSILLTGKSPYCYLFFKLRCMPGPLKTYWQEMRLLYGLERNEQSMTNLYLVPEWRPLYFFPFVTGNSAAKTLRMFNIMNVACISESTYYRHIKSYVNPTIIQQWKAHQQQLFNSLSSQDNGLVLAGDGRCDSPGYSAKFGSYTLLEQQKNRVLDFQLVQVSDSSI